MNKYYVVGIMSGTSLDGIDVVWSKLCFNKKWFYKIIDGKTYEYSSRWKSELQNAHKLQARDLVFLDKKLGNYIGEKINNFLNEKKIQKSQVDLISSHGHTLFHEPENNLTKQIGNGAYICSTTNIKTISDFRTIDIAFGGQGAPLVPIGDQLLFGSYKGCLNLGGIANLTINCEGSPRAFDVAPCNQILNKIANRMGLSFDQDGKMASSGNLLKSWYASLRTPIFYQKKGPKSISNEWVEKEVLNKLPEQESPQDLAFTFCKFVGDQIAESLSETVFNNVLLSGGGVYNKTLIRAIERALGVKVVVPKREIINFKEALNFSFMAVLKLREEVNVLKSVTGGLNNTSSGVYYSP